MKSREEKSLRAQKGWLDEESQALLLLYRERRLASATRPLDSTVHTEISHLRSLVLASRSLGGQETLRGLRDDPDTAVKILRGEWPRKHTTLAGMLLTLMRSIELTVPDREQAGALQQRIRGGLYPRPTTNRRPQFLPRTVGGYTHQLRSRPILTQLHLHQIVEASASASPEPVVVRDQALIAAICWSGLSSVEAPAITYERLEWRTPTARAPWCAVIHGIARGRRLVSIPIHANAAPFLQALHETTASEGRLAIGPVFKSRRRRGAPLSYSHVVRIREAAVAGAGLPKCDDTTLRRAYTAYLKQCGLNEYAIRDALGVKGMETVDRLLGPSRGAASQRIAAEHHLIELPSPPANDPTGLQLPLPLASHPERESPSRDGIRLIGIDCAYRRSGWAILTRGIDGQPTLVAWGAIVPEGHSRSEGLMSIERKLEDILRQWKPTRALLERPGRWIHREGSSRQSIEVMAMARGTMLKACGQLAIPVQEVDFQRVRVALLGRANATKTSAVELVSYLGLDLPRRPRGGVDLDVVDAIIMALYGLENRPVD